MMRFHHHEVAHAQRGHQAVRGVQVAVRGAHLDHVAHQDVARLVRIAALVHCPPGAEVAPLLLQLHGEEARGLFHHRVVDGIRRAGGKGGGVEAQEVHVPGSAVHGLAAGREHPRGQALQRGKEGPGSEHEHAAVPEIFAGVHERLGAGRIGFLHECPQ
jgi:hypothetical protein